MKTELKLQAYLDNELDPGEARKIAEHISNDPEARALYSELRETKHVLAEVGEMPLRLEETREFYWSQIQRRIESEERSAAKTRSRPWWFQLMAPAAGAVALFAIFLSLNTRQKTQPFTAAVSGTHPSAGSHEIVSTADDVSAVTFGSDSDGMTIVWVSTE